MDRNGLLERNPYLVAHIICESLGYFSVNAAVYALECYMEDKACFCEWYYACAPHKTGRTREEDMIEFGKSVVLNSMDVRRRAGHSGYMASFEQAFSLVLAELKYRGCTSQMLASWF